MRILSLILASLCGPGLGYLCEIPGTIEVMGSSEEVAAFCLGDAVACYDPITRILLAQNKADMRHERCHAYAHRKAEFTIFRKYKDDCHRWFQETNE